MVAQVAGLDVGFSVHSLGDAHLHANHLDQAPLEDFQFADVTITDYNPQPGIKAPIAV